MRVGGLSLPEARFPTACREREFGDGSRRCWRAAWRRWRQLPAEPLHVTACCASPYIAAIDGALHLDAILSAACLSLWASVVEESAEPYIIPLPLALAWVSPDGRPLWYATELRPIGAAATGAAYLHRRYPTDRADLAARQAAPTRAGRYKDVRLPLPVTTTEAVEGWCIGDCGEVARLLDGITHIGRKAAHGRGRVLRWQVEPAAEIAPADILDRRAVPVDSLADGDWIDPARYAPRLGWTPPYWHPASQAPVRTARWTR